MKLGLDSVIIMHRMQYPRILAFVEGSMEQLFLNNNFHYVEVISISNGISWTVAALCLQIVTFFKARDADSDAFIVWIDREKRKESAEFVKSEIYKALIAAGAPCDRVHVLVCDLMSENIILADEIYISQKFNIAAYTYTFEGQRGKHYLKAMFSNLGEHYRETIHGVAALKAVRLERCAKVSASVAAFLATFQLSCWWIEDTPKQP